MLFGAGDSTGDTTMNLQLLARLEGSGSGRYHGR